MYYSMIPLLGIQSILGFVVLVKMSFHLGNIQNQHTFYLLQNYCNLLFLHTLPHLVPLQESRHPNNTQTFIKILRILNNAYRKYDYNIIILINKTIKWERQQFTYRVSTHCESGQPSKPRPVATAAPSLQHP